MRYCLHCGAANTDESHECFACTCSLTGPLEADADAVLLHNRYRLLTQIGSGGFGAVYRALDTQEHDLLVAVKQIHLSGLSPQQVIEATDGFNRELQLLSDSLHPHIPKIYDHFTDPEHWYLVMQFIDGETLETYLHNNWSTNANSTRTLPLDEVLDLAAQLCDVLQYLHERQPAIIFRDLKPANIMRTSQGNLYLIDFGIARRYKPGKVKDTIPFGSPGYAAPEQYGKAQTTPRADIYSLGALLHQLLSGTDPSLNPFSFAPLRLYGQDGLTELETLITTMVALDASKRPATIEQINKQIQSIIQQRQQGVTINGLSQIDNPQSSLSGPQSQNYTSAYYVPGGQMQQQLTAQRKKKISRRVVMIGGVTAAALFMSSDLVSLASNIFSPITGRREGMIQEGHSSGLPRVDTWSYDTILTAQPQRLVRYSPDGQRFVAVDKQNTVTIWASGQIAMYEQRSQFHVESKDPIHAVEWFRDGTALFAVTEQQVYFLDLQQLKAIPLKLDLHTPIATLVWHPTDASFLVSGQDGSISIFTAINPDQLTDWKLLQRCALKKPQAPMSRGPLANATWSDQGDQVASLSPANEINIWMAKTGEHVLKIPMSLDGGKITYLSWYKGNNQVLIVGTSEGVLHLIDWLRPGDSERLQLPGKVAVQDVAQFLPGSQLFIATSHGLYVWYPMSGLKALEQLKVPAVPDNLLSITVAGNSQPIVLGTTGTNEICTWQ
ncbi:hypothetical protein KDW_53480 [Dictyobacter vulcani]|uniref:non-specific serine/threonine protein kinase n=1 Tax=Dictyobacter vulcani TaxID=2607529 RepID=A0A5J4L144_9CHLR|nr:WD40 repeat domain-containing serine/threonine protein kinase [Dictyobacter vulcani]GER91186.1 hypothetical protein KDW_53480 [Dictyobacter vulcani]